MVLRHESHGAAFNARRKDHSGFQVVLVSFQRRVLGHLPVVGQDHEDAGGVVQHLTLSLTVLSDLGFLLEVNG